MEVYSRENRRPKEAIPTMPFKEPDGSDMVLANHLKLGKTQMVGGQAQTVAEFIGTGDFAAEWKERTRFEVEAGRESEPLLYQPLYDIVEDASLPELISIKKMGEAGVVFEEVTEGGEVKFMSVSESEASVRIRQYGVGLEYNKRLVMYNQLWEIPRIERRVGVAHNALLNHLHLSPFLTASYGAANQTDGDALSWESTQTLPERYLRTLEQAMENAAEDTANPRPGPYALLMGTTGRFTMERALGRVPQEGFSVQSSAIEDIRFIIRYNGWTGTRGKKSVTYDGVTSGKAYLIDIGLAAEFHQSYVKQGLQDAMGESDMSRFILEQIIWDTFLGVYCAPLSTTEEITLPTMTTP